MRIDPVDQPKQATTPKSIKHGLVAAIEHDVAELHVAGKGGVRAKFQSAMF
ncbi:MAG: hypothetical protein AB7E55_36600 [Pigmentiphaga sp.]